MTLQEEKARELIARMWVTPSMIFNDVKQCALLAVDEILSMKSIITELPDSETKMVMESYARYWQEVKKELNKL